MDPKVIIDASWGYHDVFLGVNCFFLSSYVALYLFVRFCKHIQFDRFQVSCILLFCLIFICKST